MTIVWSDAASRYLTPIADIFSPESKLQLQLKVEAVLALVQSDLGLISEQEAMIIVDATKKVKLERVQAIEKEIHHDLMAVVKALSEQAGAAGEKVHKGATSTDIQDTVLALQLTKTKTMLLDILDEVSGELYNLAHTYRSLACIGRTHGQFAVPTTVGFKFANFLYELHYSKQVLLNSDVHLSKFSGAVGNYASTNRTDIEYLVLEKLGLTPVPISTQVVSRVIISTFLHAIALCSSTLEHLSKEIRNLQRSEINEWQEPFSSAQVGSSAMPHKRNPHKSERISGLSRIIRSNVGIALENISLEHERDITHSSVERIILPESSNLLYYIAAQMKNILKSLVVNETTIKENLDRAGSRSLSERILTEITPVVGRQKGHEMLRKHANATDFKAALMKDEELTPYLGVEQLKTLFQQVPLGLSEHKTKEICNLYMNSWKNYRN